MRGLATLMALLLLAGCGKRGGAPEPDTRTSDARGAAGPGPATAAVDPAAPASPQDAADRERALAFLAALDKACEQGTPAPALPMMPSRLRAVIHRRQALIDGALDVVCVRDKLGLPEDEPAGLEEALGMAAFPFPADWVEQLERMCADANFHYNHLANLRFPKNQHFLMETPREDGMRALAAARCLARRLVGDGPPSEWSAPTRGLMFRLNNLHEAIAARYTP